MIMDPKKLYQKRVLKQDKPEPTTPDTEKILQWWSIPKADFRTSNLNNLIRSIIYTKIRSLSKPTINELSQPKVNKYQTKPSMFLQSKELTK